MEAPHGVKSAIGNLVNAALTKGMAKSMMRLRMASKSIGFNRCELGMRGGVNGASDTQIGVNPIGQG